MNANRVIIIIMVILVALALLSVLSKFTMKREPQPVTTAAATVEKTVAKINAPVAKKVAEKETIIIKEKEEVFILLLRVINHHDAQAPLRRSNPWFPPHHPPRR